MALVLVVMVALVDAPGRSDGPLVQTSGDPALDVVNGWNETTPGEGLIAGWTVFENRGDRPVVLSSADFAARPAGVEILEVVVAPARSPLPGVLRGDTFPPADLEGPAPIEGYVVAPGAPPVSVVVHFRTDGRDHLFGGTVVSYESGGERYTVEEPVRMRLCETDCSGA